MSKRTLYEKALNTDCHARFVARYDDLNRPLTDEEVKETAQYIIDTVDYSGREDADIRKIKRQMLALLKG